MEYRSATPDERLILDLLCEPDYPGVDQIRTQLKSVMVRELDAEGSFSLEVEPLIKAPVTHRVPIELRSHDADGVEVFALLHVIDGIFKEVEIYKASPDPILKITSLWEVYIN